MNIQSIVQINGTEIRLESLAQASLILIAAITIVLSNIIYLSSYLNYKGIIGEIICIMQHLIFKKILLGPMEVINYYYLSLSVADLICGIFIVPLSVYPALIGIISFFPNFFGFNSLQSSLNTVWFIVMKNYNNFDF